MGKGWWEAVEASANGRAPPQHSPRDRRFPVRARLELDQLDPQPAAVPGSSCSTAAMNASACSRSRRARALPRSQSSQLRRRAPTGP
jgi:hypothetical protein